MLNLLFFSSRKKEAYKHFSYPFSLIKTHLLSRSKKRRQKVWKLPLTSHKVLWFRDSAPFLSARSELKSLQPSKACQALFESQLKLFESFTRNSNKAFSQVIRKLKQELRKSFKALESSSKSSDAKLLLDKCRNKTCTKHLVTNKTWLLQLLHNSEQTNRAHSFVGANPICGELLFQDRSTFN